MCSVITACGSLQGSSLLLEVQGRALRSLRCTSGTMVQTKFSQENDSSSILIPDQHWRTFLHKSAKTPINWESTT